MQLPQLSMGMSDDFPVAIEEGATLVRVGTAIFGKRLKVERDPSAMKRSSSLCPICVLTV